MNTFLKKLFTSYFYKKESRMWPFDRNNPMPIGAVRTNKKHWHYDDRVGFGLKQVRKIRGEQAQLKWLEQQMEFLAGKNDSEALNLCVDVIHQCSIINRSKDSTHLFFRSTDILDRIRRGESGDSVLTSQ